jgi:hypothetical protein
VLTGSRSTCNTSRMRPPPHSLPLSPALWPQLACPPAALEQAQTRPALQRGGMRWLGAYGAVPYAVCTLAGVQLQRQCMCSKHC